MWRLCVAVCLGGGGDKARQEPHQAAQEGDQHWQRPEKPPGGSQALDATKPESPTDRRSHLEPAPRPLPATGTPVETVANFDQGRLTQ